MRSAVIALCILAGLSSARTGSNTPQPRSQEEYRDHLRSLATLIAQCQQHIDAAHCNADAVGPDDIVTATQQAGPRRIPYGWLRGLLDRIGSQKISPADAGPLLKTAAQRIQLEQSEAPGTSIATSPALFNHATERSALTAILERAEF